MEILVILKKILKKIYKLIYRPEITKVSLSQNVMHDMAKLMKECLHLA